MATLSLDTLYRVYDASGDKMIEIVGGTVDLYYTLVEPTSSPITDDLNSYDTIANNEMKKLDAVPAYMYVTQNTGTTTYVRISGIRVEAV